jgi:hypothetical protein
MNEEQGCEERDDAPVNFRLRRRSIVGGASAVLVGLSLSPVSVLYAAATDTGSFMQLSRLLIQHELDETVGMRIASVMSARTPGLEAQIDGLLAIAKNKNAKVVEEFFPDIPEGPLRATALAIIYVWYAGVMVDEPGEQVFAFELALVFQPTRDVMTIPTYASGKPNGWSAVSPPLGNVPRFRADIT